MADKTSSSFSQLKKTMEEVRQISHEISSSMEEQKGANRSILDSVGKINRMGSEIAVKTKEETLRGKSRSQFKAAFFIKRRISPPGRTKTV